MIQPGDEETWEALLIYARACRQARQEPERARLIWLTADTSLAWWAAFTNANHTDDVFFLWRMANRRAQIEVGNTEEWGHNVHQW